MEPSRGKNRERLPMCSKDSYPILFSLLRPGCHWSLCTLPCPLSCTQRGQKERAAGLPLEPLVAELVQSLYCPSTVPLPALLPGVGRPALEAKVIPASRLLPSCFPLLKDWWNSQTLGYVRRGKQYQPSLLNTPYPKNWCYNKLPPQNSLRNSFR